jgi:hypothetical protein
MEIELSERKDKEKEALHDCITLVKEKLGIEQSTKETNPLEAFKILVEAVVEVKF